MNINKCKERIGDRTGFHFYQCTRNIWKDGYCKTHHPETVKERQEKSAKRWEERYNSNPLVAANKRIKELEEEVERLCTEIIALQDKHAF